MSDSALRFGVFELDRSTGELLKRGMRVRLQEQPSAFWRRSWNDRASSSQYVRPPPDMTMARWNKPSAAGHVR